MSPFAIETDRLTRCFGSVTAVDSLTLAVAQGELFGLVGSDGAGKTTTLRMLAGVMDPTGGTARVLGRDAAREAEAIRPDIGYMSQRFGLYQDLTVRENLRFYADLFGVTAAERAERMDRLLSFSSLAPFGNRRAGNLSGGMKQKLGLACALIHTPRVLFLDEPTNGVDPVSRREFWRILLQLVRQGVTIMVSTAYLDEAERCHRVGLIHQGKLLACDTPNGLKALMKGALLEIRTTEPRRAARLLRDGFPPLAVGLFGDRIHLVTDDPALGESNAVRLLQQGGIVPLGIRRVEPSLEDIYVSVLGKNGGER